MNQVVKLSVPAQAVVNSVNLLGRTIEDLVHLCFREGGYQALEPDRVMSNAPLDSVTRLNSQIFKLELTVMQLCRRTGVLSVVLSVSK